MNGQFVVFHMLSMSSSYLSVDPTRLFFIISLFLAAASSLNSRWQNEDIPALVTSDDIRRLRTKKSTDANGLVLEEENKSSLDSVADRWPNAEVPFVVELRFDGNPSQNSEEFSTAFREAIQLINGKTCIRFRPMRAGDRFFVRIFNGEGCTHFANKIT